LVHMYPSKMQINAIAAIVDIDISCGKVLLLSPSRLSLVALCFSPLSPYFGSLCRVAFWMRRQFLAKSINEFRIQ
jgi:hypothetical protein